MMLMLMLRLVSEKEYTSSRCHYFSKEGGGSQKTTLSLIKDVTFSLGRVGVKGNSVNVTEYDVFFTASLSC